MATDREADTAVPALETRVAHLAFELEQAVRFDRGAILLAVYRSEWVREEAAQLLTKALHAQGQQVTAVNITPQLADLPALLRRQENREETIFFVSGLQFGGGEDGLNAYRALNIRREYFLEHRLRVVFWLTETEEATLARHAPDFWSFRHRTLVFLDTPRPESIQTQAEGIAWRDRSYEMLRPDTANRIQWREQLLAELPETEETTQTRAELLFTLGESYAAQNNYSKAQPLFEEAIERFEQIGDSRGVAVTQSSLADLLKNRGQYDEAERLYRLSLDVKEQIGDRREVAVTQSSLADLLKTRGQYDEAERLYRLSLDVFEQIGDSRGVAVTQSSLADLLKNRGQYDEAERLYRLSLDVKEQIGDRREVAVTQSSLADLLKTRGQYDEAERLYRLSLEHDEQIGDSRGVAVTQVGLADLLAATGKEEQAEESYLACLKIFQELQDAYSFGAVQTRLAQLYIQQTRHDEATALLQAAREIFTRLQATQWITAIDQMLAQIQQTSDTGTDLIALVKQARDGDKQAGGRAWELCNQLTSSGDPQQAAVGAALRRVLADIPPAQAFTDLPSELRDSLLAAFE